MINCCTCYKDFKFGPHEYRGRKIIAYDIMVCDSCFRGNWDGWQPHLENRVTANLLAQKKLLPNQNSNGLLPRGDEIA